MSASEPCPRAQHVCIRCKIQKRKCDKALPNCSTCIKKGVRCEYRRGDDTPATATPDFEIAWPNLADPYSLAEPKTINLPTILFLDPYILRNGPIDIPQSSISASHILQFLGDTDEIHSIVSRFYTYVHTWMPFISKKRLGDSYLRGSFPSRADIILLLLCIKLITALPPTEHKNPRTSLYYIAKHFHLELEGSEMFTLPVLQAGVLLALYEIGHAIYPAAFLSISACARYAQALGISIRGSMGMRKALTMVEVEEQRRAWWAIVILERFVNIGCPGRPFVSAEPSLDDFLPVDDEAWDRGVIEPDHNATISSPKTAHMSSFALLCQAAHLLGQVLRYVSSGVTLEDEVGVQLDRTLYSMLHASLALENPDYDQICFIYSTLVALHLPILHAQDTDGASLPHAQLANRVINHITDSLISNKTEGVCPLTSRDPQEMSPWGCFFAYHVCGVHMRVTKTSAVSAEIVKLLKSSFMVIDVRWNVAGMYLQLLEARKAMELV